MEGKFHRSVGCLNGVVMAVTKQFRRLNTFGKMMGPLKASVGYLGNLT